jgi:hypothetical protein
LKKSLLDTQIIKHARLKDKKSGLDNEFIKEIIIIARAIKSALFIKDSKSKSSY